MPKPFSILGLWFCFWSHVYHCRDSSRLQPGRWGGRPGLRQREKPHTLLHIDGSDNNWRPSFEGTDHIAQPAQSETVRVSGLLWGAEVQGLEVCTDPGAHVGTGRKRGESRQPAAVWKVLCTSRRKALWDTGLVAILGLQIVSRETVLMIAPTMIQRREGGEKKKNKKGSPCSFFMTKQNQTKEIPNLKQCIKALEKDRQRGSTTFLSDNSVFLFKVRCRCIWKHNCLWLARVYLKASVLPVKRYGTVWYTEHFQGLSQFGYSSV